MGTRRNTSFWSSRQLQVPVSLGIVLQNCHSETSSGCPESGGQPPLSLIPGLLPGATAWLLLSSAAPTRYNSLPALPEGVTPFAHVQTRLKLQ